MKTSPRLSACIAAAFACALLALFSGCATIGQDFKFKGPESLKVGKTTKQEVLKRYGEPFRVGYDSGKPQWTYLFYRYNAFTTTRTKDLVVTFDQNQVVSDYTYGSSLDEDQDIEQ